MAFLVLVGTDDPDADDMPYYYSSFSEFREAFQSIANAYDDGDLEELDIQAGSLEVQADILNLERLLPSSPRSAVSHPIEFRDYEQPTYRPPWPAGQGPFD